jgi:hypothetical protein
MVRQELFLHYRMVFNAMITVITAGTAAMIGYLILLVRL